VKSKKPTKAKNETPKVEKEVGAFDYINSIMKTKVNLMRGTDNDELAEKGYPAFMANRALSMHPDTIMLANEMNLRGNMDERLQYEYLLEKVRQKNRGYFWPKKEKDESISILQEALKCNRQRAEEWYSVLGDEAVEAAKRMLAKGGKVK
jgi:hypothetical protein